MVNLTKTFAQIHFLQLVCRQRLFRLLLERANGALPIRFINCLTNIKCLGEARRFRVSCQNKIANKMFIWKFNVILYDPFHS